MMLPLLWSRWRYYLRSIPTLLLGFRRPWRVLRSFAGLAPAAPFQVALRTGEQFYVRGAMDLWIIKETCLDRDYEVYGTPLQPGWTVLDIGAALGDFAISAARRFPSMEVHAVEPFPESFALLQANRDLNQVQNLHLHPLAISAGAAELLLETGSGSAVRHSTAQAAATSQQLRVQSRSLGHLLQELGLARVDLLKMDCEGAEYDILLHAESDTLQRIQRIVMEYHDALTPYSHHDLVHFLGTQGFHVRTQQNPAHREIGFLYAVRS